MHPLTKSVDAAGAVSFQPDVIRPETVYSNAAALARFAGDDADGSRDSVRTAYLGSLNVLQQIEFPWQHDQRAPVVDFGDDARSEALLARLMSVDSLPEEWRYQPEERTEIEERIEAAFARLHALDPPLEEAIRDTVGTLVIGRCNGFGGGSVSDVIGVIWMAPEEHWDVNEYAETLLHEYIHQSLFLDEMVNSLFAENVPRMAEEDALVTSTILKRRRGYDKSFHSAFVAFGLLQMREAQGRLEDAEEYAEGIWVTTDELAGRLQFLTPHGQALLDEFSAALDANETMRRFLA
jgi:hypothetical protein